MSMVFGAGVEGGYHDQNSHDASHAYQIAPDSETVKQPPPKPNSSHASFDERLAIDQRSANRHILEQVEIPDAQHGVPGGAIKILGAQKGRKWVLLQCPTGAAASVVISHNADTLEQATPNGYVLTAGSNPVKFESEAAIYAITGTPGTSTVLNMAQGFAVPDEIRP